MEKYYIEIYDKQIRDYLVQSQWFDTYEEAVKWAKNITFLKEWLEADVMAAKFNGEECEDIYFVERVR